jgi:hypothetical protein
MYDDLLGVPMGRPGGVFGGVGSETFCMKVSVKASTEEFMAGKAPVMDGKSSGSSVSSTITIDLLPVVIAISLVGRASMLSDSAKDVSMCAAEHSSSSPGTREPAAGGGDR